MRPVAMRPGFMEWIWVWPYHGIDIVPGLIADLQQRADAGELPGTYKLADLTCDDLPGCDVILCRDCLVHLSFANVERAVANMAAIRGDMADHHDLHGLGWKRRL